MQRRPLRWKILIYSSSLLITLIAAMLIYVNYQAAWFVNEHIQRDLETGIRRISDAQNEHLAGLELAAQLIASFPELKALLTTTDLATIRDYLLDYQQRNKRPELLMVLDRKGQMVARTDTLAPIPIPDALELWIEPAISGQNVTDVLPTDRATYLASIAPATAGGMIFGFVIAGSRIDDAFARSLQDLCSRLCSLAGPGEILLSEPTYELVKGLVAAQPLEPLRIKGLSEAVSVYRMTVGERR